MWPVIVAVARRYVLPAVVFPVALVIGVIGYNMESLFSDRYTPSRTMSVAEERERRLLQESGDPLAVQSLKQSATGSVLSKNLSPSLSQTGN